jgi:predicted amidohydrolase
MRVCLNIVGYPASWGPDGIDQARTGSGEEMIFADLSKDHLKQVRQSLSHIKDRRTNLYS